MIILQRYNQSACRGRPSSCQPGVFVTVQSASANQIQSVFSHGALSITALVVLCWQMDGVFFLRPSEILIWRCIKQRAVPEGLEEMERGAPQRLLINGRCLYYQAGRLLLNSASTCWAQAGYFYSVLFCFIWPFPGTLHRCGNLRRHPTSGRDEGQQGGVVVVVVVVVVVGQCLRFKLWYLRITSDWRLGINLPRHLVLLVFRVRV